MKVKKKTTVIEVREGNELVEASFGLSSACLKTFDYICMLSNTREVKKNSDGDIWVDFDFKQYTSLMHVDPQGYYKKVREVLTKLQQCTFIYIDSNKKLHITGLIKEAIYDTTDCFAKIQLSKNLIPFMCGLPNCSGNYTTYYLENIMSLESKYAIRLYKIFKEQYDKEIYLQDNRELEEKRYSPAILETDFELEEFVKMLGLKYKI